MTPNKVDPECTYRSQDFYMTSYNQIWAKNIINLGLIFDLNVILQNNIAFEINLKQKQIV